MPPIVDLLFRAATVSCDARNRPCSLHLLAQLRIAETQRAETVLRENLNESCAKCGQKRMYWSCSASPRLTAWSPECSLILTP